MIHVSVEWNFQLGCSEGIEVVYGSYQSVQFCPLKYLLYTSGLNPSKIVVKEIIFLTKLRTLRMQLY